MDINPKDVLTTQEACGLLRVTRQTLYSWVLKGKITPWKKLPEGSGWLFLRQELGGRPFKKYERKKAPQKGISILLISRDPLVLGEPVEALGKREYQVLTAGDIFEGLDIFKKHPSDLILLDMDIPGPISAWRRLSAMKEQMKFLGGDIPPFFLFSGKFTRPDDAAMALKEGAWDYLNKPFDPGVFLARAERILRRRVQSEMQSSGPTVQSKDGLIVLDNQRRMVQVFKRKKDKTAAVNRLTPKEFDLLSLLLKREGWVFNRRLLLEIVWGYVVDIDTRTVDRHIENLRKKLGPQGVRLEAFYGRGYCLA